MTDVKIINPFTDIALQAMATPADNGQGVFMSNLKELNIGDGGNNVFRADKNGIWLGSDKFITAPFSVAMSGAITASSLTLIGGTIRYGKTAWADSTHAGYYIGNEGIYMASAADATLFKFTIASGLIDHIGTVSGRSTATLASAINASGEATAIINNLVTTLKIADSQVTAAKTSIAAINPVDGEINANKVGTTQILASAVTPSKITSYNFQLSAGSFTNNSPSAGRVAWTGAKVVYNGTEYSITNGSCLATDKHVYWQLASPTVFTGSATLPALGNDDFLVAFNNSGTALLVWNSTIINGNRITAGSVAAAQISAHSITANEINVSQLSAISADMGSITAGTITGALIRTSATANVGVKIGTVGGDTGIFIYGDILYIKDTSGNTTGYLGGALDNIHLVGTSGRDVLIGSYQDIILDPASGYGVMPVSSGKDLGQVGQYWGGIFGTTLYVGGSAAYWTYSGSKMYCSNDTHINGTLDCSGALECATARIKIGTTDFYVTADPNAAGKYYLRSG